MGPWRGLWAAGDLALASRVSSQRRALGPGFTPLSCSPTVLIKGALGSQRGTLFNFSFFSFFNFSFCKVLSQEGQGLEELLDVAGASEAGRPWCPLSLAPNPL